MACDVRRRYRCGTIATKTEGITAAAYDRGDPFLAAGRPGGTVTFRARPTGRACVGRGARTAGGRITPNGVPAASIDLKLARRPAAISTQQWSSLRRCAAGAAAADRRNGANGIG